MFQIAWVFVFIQRMNSKKQDIYIFQQCIKFSEALLLHFFTTIKDKAANKGFNRAFPMVALILQQQIVSLI